MKSKPEKQVPVVRSNKVLQAIARQLLANKCDGRESGRLPGGRKEGSTGRLRLKLALKSQPNGVLLLG